MLNKSQMDSRQLSDSGTSATGSSLGAAPLEDFIEEIQQRVASEPNAAQQTDLTIEAQLAAKDRDLILAAELGKALLERNEQLTLANEHITEDYSHKLEVNNVFCSSKFWKKAYNLICLQSNFDIPFRFQLLSYLSDF
jgi:hypothetical protein